MKKQEFTVEKNMSHGLKIETCPVKCYYPNPVFGGC